MVCHESARCVKPCVCQVINQKKMSKPPMHWKTRECKWPHCKLVACQFNYRGTNSVVRQFCAIWRSLDASVHARLSCSDLSYNWVITQSPHTVTYIEGTWEKEILTKTLWVYEQLTEQSGERVTEVFIAVSINLIKSRLCTWEFIFQGLVGVRLPLARHRLLKDVL